MLENVNGRGFCQKQKVQMGIPLRGRMSGKCTGTTPGSGNDCSAGGPNCEHDSNTSKCKCKDGFYDTANGCVSLQSKCGARCNTQSGQCDSTQCTVPGGDPNCVPDSENKTCICKAGYTDSDNGCQATVKGGPVNCAGYNNSQDNCLGAANNGFCWFDKDNKTCHCSVGYGSANKDGTDCAPCKDNTYKDKAGYDTCTACDSGKSAALANGTVSTDGPNTQCVASSASPLAIVIICAMIISIIASIATAAVMIRRKATNARAAEAIVSDAL